MKKIICILMTVFLLCAFAVPAFAADLDTAETSTADKPVLLETAEDWADFAAYAAENDTTDTYFALGADIGSEEAPVTVVVENFSGTLFGNNHSVWLAVDLGSGQKAGLFGNCDGALIRDITVKGSVKGGSYCGGVCAYASNATMLINCVNEAQISGSSWVGGVCGQASGESIVSDCANYAAVTGTGSTVGGVCGSLSNAYLMDSANYDAVKGKEKAGGICGKLYLAQVTNCLNMGEVSITAAKKTYGNLCGYSDSLSTVENSVGAFAGAAFSGTAVSCENCWQLTDTGFRKVTEGTEVTGDPAEVTAMVDALNAKAQEKGWAKWDEKENTPELIRDDYNPTREVVPPTGSTLSGGSVAVITAIVGLVIGFLAGALVFKKKAA